MPASQILMVRPVNFGFNNETAISNKFQQSSSLLDVKSLAVSEFDQMVQMLTEAGIEVQVFEDSVYPITPDAIFPNNWISTSSNGQVTIFPMEANNRRLERRTDILNFLEENFLVSTTIDLTVFEKENKFLEGTGSIVFDHDNKVAYACLSSRTNKEIFNDYCHRIGYQPISFLATDQNGHPIYHTNVLMNVGTEYIVICLESILLSDQSIVLSTLRESDKEIILINQEQMNHFAGNMIQLKGINGFETIISKSAYNSLTKEQISKLETYSHLLVIPIPTIEKIGGGSVRCMIAENFLTKK